MTEPENGSATKLIRLETFDTAIAIDPTEEDAAKRRFMTLLLDERDSNRGNNGCVLRAQNTAGEVFALKTLIDGAIAGHRHGTDATRSPEETSLHLASTAALFEEYRNLCAVSHLRGFPRAYGYGTSQGDPMILMEWVEGTPLAHVAERLPHDAPGNVNSAAVAAMGCAVTRVLLGAQSLSTPIVHRDLSPANIILRTTDHSVGEQIAALDFDLCLIDMGSSSAQAPASALTMRADIWRFATPAYAAPEMLTQDIPGAAAKRRDPAVDVYALCSLLYELYAGRLPFDIATVGSAAGGSYYLLKTEQAPRALTARKAADQPLVDIIMQGLAVEPDDRPSEAELFAALGSMLPKAVSGAGPLDNAVQAGSAQAGTHLTIDVAAECIAAALADERERAVTRRKFIAAGVGLGLVVLGGAGIATRGFGIPDRLRGIRQNLDDYSWDELQEISLKIKTAASDDEARQIAIEYHLLNAEGHIPYPSVKTITLANGLTVGAQLVGLRHDTLADDAGKAGLSFLLDAGIARRNAADEPAANGWKGCDLRAWLDRDGMKLLPRKLRAMIKPVMKVSNNVGATNEKSALSALRASLWLPAMVELVGPQLPTDFSEDFHYLAGLYNGEGTEYQLFRELKTTPFGANKQLERTWKSGSVCWWQRTVSPDCTETEGVLYLNRVGRNGDAFSYATAADHPTKPTCVIPGFCI